MLDPGGAERLVAEMAEEALFIYAPEPWALLAGKGGDAAAIQVPGVHEEQLDELVAHAPERPVAVGIGGGTALDAAKYVALRRQLPLVLVPSILSVDAAFTQEAGVRRARRVDYIGPVVPDRVVVDPVLIRTAPPPLNRAGVGDLLSCHTALRDWEIAEEDSSPAGPAVPWDEGLAELGRETLDSLGQHAEEIGAVTDAGVGLLAEGFARIGKACTAAGHARFEEGSEHFFAYALEAETGKTYIHGELIAFSTLALSVLQQNRPEFVASVIARTQVRAHPQHHDLDEDVFVRVMTSLPRYVRDANLWWSCLDRETIDDKRARKVWAKTLRLLDVREGAATT